LDLFDRKNDNFIHYGSPGKGSARTIFQDSRANIWIGTADGLFKLDEKTKKFKKYVHRDSDSTSISNDFIYRVVEDKQGRLWIATKDGLNLFNPKTEVFSCFRAGSYNTVASNWIKTVYRDKHDFIWVGTQGGGISRIDTRNLQFKNYQHIDRDKKSLAHNDILSFSEDRFGDLWVGTENGGISILNSQTDDFYTFKNEINNINSISNNSIHGLYRDDVNNMWVGTWSGGVNFLPAFGDKFTTYAHVSDNPNSLSSNSLLSVANDSRGNIWVGTDGGGLNNFNASTGRAVRYLNNPKIKNSISSDFVNTIIEVEPDLIALGFHRGGFDLFDIKAEKFTHVAPLTNNKNSLAVLSVTVLMKDRKQQIWVGTWGGGLQIFDKNKKAFIQIYKKQDDEKGIANNFIKALLEDKNGDIWIGTENGLDRLNPATGHFTHYRNSKDKNSISNNLIECLIEDSKGNLWVGTAGGLNIYNRDDDNFSAIREGLPNHMIRNVLEDKAGKLWISSNQGLTRYDVDSKQARNYGITDGLQGSEFKSRCSFRAPDGKLYFGGSNGLNAFYPDSIKMNNFIPPVYITSFQIFNKAEALTDTIRLKHNQSVFTFEFAALNFTLPDKNSYAYKLKGFDKDWNYVGHKRTATYTNLDPGTYTFTVIGSNNDGLWNKTGTSILVIIEPPFWLTWWFRILSTLVFAGVILLVFFFRTKNIQNQKKALETQVSEKTSQLLHMNVEERKARLEAEQARHDADEANKAKSIFLATMSHEIRTPMNGVIGMSSLLAQTALTAEQHSYLSTIHSSAESLLIVINDILDFSKIESGKLELEERDFDLCNCLEDVTKLFAAKTIEKSNSLSYHIEEQVPVYLKGDAGRLRQVLINLIGNAMKFTANGEIHVRVFKVGGSNGSKAEIGFEVKDTGIGIPAGKIDRLFKAFSQVDSSTTRKYGGTGLGLVICEKLVTLMGGKISVTSAPGKGSAFCFSIVSSIGLAPAVPAHKPSRSSNGVLSKDFARRFPMKIMVAEDNQINQLLALTVLEKLGYKPALAKNGVEALEMSRSENFDLILMDIQMPEMDGHESTRLIRNGRYRQPVIVAMTANAIDGDREQCLASGMNDYISKPINLEQLVLCLEKWSGGIHAALSVN
ncbi:MAG: response regulator, partial [Gemmatimonadaceae bacterium]|nr:response regulator [Chitinophagaceae bacterium]